MKDVQYINRDKFYEWFHSCPSIAIKWAEKWGVKHKDVYTVKSVWDEWDSAFNNRIPLELIQGLGITPVSDDKQSNPELITDFINSSAKNTFIITSSSVDESRLYLASVLLLQEGLDTESLQNKVLCVDTADGFKALLENSSSLIVVTSLQDASLNNKALARGMKIIQVLRRTNTNQKIDIHLPLRITSADFENILKETKNIKELSNVHLRSGRNLTYLRNVLGGEPPKWINENKNSSLLAALLVGGWSSESEDDKAIMCELSGKSTYSDFTSELQESIISDNPPIQHEAPYYRSVSSFSSWPTVIDRLTGELLKKYKDICIRILGKEDNIKRLPYEDQNMARFRGIENPFSSLLRDSLADSLIHLSMNNPYIVDEIVYQICSGDARHWKSLSPFLSELAEASPDSFIKTLEELCERDTAKIKQLINEKGNVLEHFGDYVLILHALELIAWDWDNNYLERISELLIKLSISWDNIPANISSSPINSLAKIFCVWYPQTIVSTEKRNLILSNLASEYPDNIWPALIEFFSRSHNYVTCSAKPKWKLELEDIPIWHDKDRFLGAEQIFKLCMELSQNNADRQIEVLKLISQGQCIPEQKDLFYKQLEEGINNKVFQNTTPLWNFLRKTIVNIQSYDRSLLINDLPILKKLYDMLSPEDIVALYAHYFYDAQNILKYEGKERYEADFDQFLVIQQKEVVSKIYKKDKEYGLFNLLKTIVIQDSNKSIHMELNAGERIFEGLVFHKVEQKKLDKFLLNSFEEKIPLLYIKGMLKKYIECYAQTMLTETFDHVYKFNNEYIFNLYLEQLPISEEQLNLINAKEYTIQKLFWQNVNVFQFRDAENKKNIINKLLEFNQSEKVLYFFDHFCKNENDYSLLYKVLSDSLDKLEQENIENNISHIRSLFERIALSANKDLNELTILEYRYAPLLDGQTPTVYKTMATDPDFFLLLISFCFESKNQVENKTKKERTKEQQNNAENAHKILFASHSNKGALLKVFRNNEGVLEVEQLERWFDHLKIAAEKQGYESNCYSILGVHFAYSDADSADNIWPEIPIRRILNKKEFDDLRNAYIRGYLNKNGSWMGSSVNHYKWLKKQVEENLKLFPAEHKYVIKMFNELLKSIDQNIKRCVTSEIYDDMGAN